MPTARPLRAAVCCAFTVPALLALLAVGCTRTELTSVTVAPQTSASAPIATASTVEAATTTTTPSTTTTTTTSTTTTTTSTTTTTTTTTLPLPPLTTLPPLGFGDSLFPDRRVVALYGNDTAAVLGVLGEQPPEAAVDRLRRVMQPFETGDRPIQGAFELIATIATAGPGELGLHRQQSSDADVQRYLDATRSAGMILILDIQPGRSDFLTEAQRYDAFLRQPDVHLALDPEWRVQPDERPGRGLVGHVDAEEVNTVAQYLAGIVAEEGLPDKLLVVHQFQTQMIGDREALVEPDGVTLTIHMDGFGTQSEKLATYAAVHAEEPFDNGFKLFYDEDIDMFTPSEVLAIDPVPDLITYQ